MAAKIYVKLDRMLKRIEKTIPETESTVLTEKLKKNTVPDTRSIEQWQPNPLNSREKIGNAKIPEPNILNDHFYPSIDTH